MRLNERNVISTRRLLAPFMFTLALALAPSSSRAENGAPVAQPVQQLRIYEIFDANKAAFHARFRDHAIRIMARYNFKILSTWETQHAKRTEFVYLLEWPDETVMAEGWAKFRADPEWIEIKRLTALSGAPIMGDIEDRVLKPTNYSPGRN